MTDPARLATLQDLHSWLELVPEVEVLFGPMPQIAVRILRGIQRGTALVVADGGQVNGAALLSPDGRPQRIRWLAVRRCCRGRGVGAALLAAILERWPTDDSEVSPSRRLRRAVKRREGSTSGSAPVFRRDRPGPRWRGAGPLCLASLVSAHRQVPTFAWPGDAPILMDAASQDRRAGARHLRAFSRQSRRVQKTPGRIAGLLLAVGSGPSWMS